MQTVHPKAALGTAWVTDLLTPVYSSASSLSPALRLAKPGTATCRWAGVASLTSSVLTNLRRDFWLLILPNRWFWSGEKHIIFGCHFIPLQGNRCPAANASEGRGVDTACGHRPWHEGHSVGITGHPSPCSIQLNRAWWQR